MKLLGAQNIIVSFSYNMNKKFETFGGTKSAKEFVEMPLNLASELINRSDFPRILKLSQQQWEQFLTIMVNVQFVKCML